MTTHARSNDGFSLDGCRTRADVDARREFLRNASRHQSRYKFSDDSLRALREVDADVAPFVVSEAPEFRTARVRRVAATTITRRARRRTKFVARWFRAPATFGSALDKVHGVALDATAGDDVPKADIQTLIRVAMRRG